MKIAKGKRSRNYANIDYRIMNKLKQQVCPHEEQITSIKAKIPAAFYQHHYINEEKQEDEKIIPRRLFHSPDTKNIVIDQEMLNHYTNQSTSTKLLKVEQDHYPSDCSPLFHTPIKNQKANLSTVPTTLPTPLNLLPPISSHQHPVQSELASLPLKGQKRERKLMIVDEWALNTEREIKKSIILSEFFKMVLDEEPSHKEQSEEEIEEFIGKKRSSSCYNQIYSKKSDMSSIRSVLSRSTKSPVKKSNIEMV